MKPQTIGIDCPNENGDIGSQNGHLKRRLNQHLLLRGHRDFDSLEAYDQFLREVLDKANQRRQGRLAEELNVMSPLPPTRLSVQQLRKLCAIRTKTLCAALEELTQQGELSRNAKGYQLDLSFPVSRSSESRAN